MRCVPVRWACRRRGPPPTSPRTGLRSPAASPIGRRSIAWLARRRPIMFGVLATRQGVDPNPWDYQTRYIDETVALGGRMYGQATTRSINAVFSLKSYLPFDGLPAWKEIRALPLAEQKRRLADPEVRRRLIADEARMKPKGSELQGGGAAMTDPRKPDYANLFPMVDVDWDDPSVADL